jgi:hypothetical protein
MSRVNLDALTNGIADIYLADALGPASRNQNSTVANTCEIVRRGTFRKTGLYKIGGVDYPVLMSIDHGTLMLRSYYGDDFDFDSRQSA